MDIGINTVAAMPLCQILRRFMSGTTRIKQNLSCPILNLPIEIILLVVERLPKYQQIIISQTCYPLRLIILENNKLQNLSPINLDKDQRQEYLFALARGRLNLWACHKCVKLHRINQHDTPMNPQPTIRCQTSWDCYIYRVNYEHHHRHIPYKLFHRHIQLALKYTRLESMGNVLKKTYKDHLNCLLQPVLGVIRPHEYGMTNKIKGTLSVSPKITTDGEFLIHSRHTFFKDVESVSIKSVGWLRICLHQFFIPEAHLHKLHIEPCQLVNRQFCSYWWNDLLTNPKSALGLVVASAFLRETEVCGSCPFCETDFSVQASPEITIVRVWQRFGSETSFSSNNSWQGQIQLPPENIVISYPPGSIRLQYG
ncbi:hypothetical protein GGI35DRAFT_453726 [Trichoderma velutinum]